MLNSTKVFLDEDFLLETETAKQLYHDFATKMPILDYHNHLSPKDIADNKKFATISEAWLEGDHYKWRAMRTNGIAEQYCTGNASAHDKFIKWAETVPNTMRNPLYHWTHLELKNYFGIHKLLDQSSAEEIFAACNSKLHQDEFSTQNLLRKMNVQVVCTTDDPIDTLEHHAKFSKTENNIKMYPTFRPDKAYAVEDTSTYVTYLDKLSQVSGVTIKTFDDLLQALQQRIDFFDTLGCRAADHGLEHMFYDAKAELLSNGIFRKILSKNILDQQEITQFKAAVLLNLCRMYNAKGWAQQFHLGALRNNSSRLLRELGPDTGFDSIGDFHQARPMSQFFNHLDNTNQLAKTIIYNLNPAANELFASMTGNFNDGSIAGKIQYGSGWWFLDQKNGMEKQIDALSNMGLLSAFVGMVTDSRSFLSFPRHEYFRRILCNMLGNDIEHGILPNDLQHIGNMVKKICYSNAKKYFEFDIP